MDNPDLTRLSHATLQAVQVLKSDSTPESGSVVTEEVKLTWEPGLLRVTLHHDDDTDEEITLGEGDISGIQLSRSTLSQGRNWLLRLFRQLPQKRHLLNVELRSSRLRMNLTLSAEVDVPKQLEGLARHTGTGLLLEYNDLKSVLSHAERLGANYRSWRSRVSLPHLKVGERPSLVVAIDPEATPQTDEEKMAALEETLARSPLNSRARHDLQALYATLSEHGKLAQLLKEEALITSSRSRKVALYARAAGIYNDVLGDAAEAATTWRTLLSLNPMHQDSFEKLSAYYEADNRWFELLDLLGDQIQVYEAATGHDSDAQLCALYLRSAHIHHHQLNDRKAALAHVENVLERDAGHEGARALFTTLLSTR